MPPACLIRTVTGPTTHSGPQSCRWSSCPRRGSQEPKKRRRRARTAPTQWPGLRSIAYWRSSSRSGRVCLPKSDRDADELLARLSALLPAEPDGAATFSDPEVAEVLVQALVGLLESALGADQHLSRDLPRALNIVNALAASGCRKTDLVLGLETLTISRFIYEDALQAPLSVLAAPPHATAERSYDSLLVANDAINATACASLTGALADAADTMFLEASQ